MANRRVERGGDRYGANKKSIAHNLAGNNNATYATRGHRKLGEGSACFSAGLRLKVLRA